MLLLFGCGGHGYLWRALAKILVRMFPHSGHGQGRLRVIVSNVPKQEANAALIAGSAHLAEDVLRRVALRAPRKRLQPWTNHDTAACGDGFKSDHRGPDEMLGLVPGMSVAVHTKEM